MPNTFRSEMGEVRAPHEHPHHDPMIDHGCASDAVGVEEYEERYVNERAASRYTSPMAYDLMPQF